MSNSEKTILIGQIVTLAIQETDTDLLDLIYKLLLENLKSEEVVA